MPVNPGSAGQHSRGGRDAKDQQLDRFRAAPEYDALTTDQGVRVDDTDNALPRVSAVRRSNGDGAPQELAESFAAAIEKHRFPHRPGMLN